MALLNATLGAVSGSTPTLDPADGGGVPPAPGRPTETLSCADLLPFVHRSELRRLIQAHTAVLDHHTRGLAWDSGEFLTTAGRAPPGLFLLTRGQVRAQWWFAGAHASGVLAERGSLIGSITPGPIPGEKGHPPLSVRVLTRAVTAVEARFLPVDCFDEVDAATGGHLRTCLRFLGELAITGPVLVDELSRVRSLRAISPAGFTRLFEESERVTFPAGHKLLGPDVDPGGILGVLEGRTLVRVAGQIVDRRGPGQIYGANTLYTSVGASSVEVEADGEVVAAHIPAARVTALLHPAVESAPTHTARVAAARTCLLVTCDDPAFSPADLTTLAAWSIAAHQPDGAVIVRLAPTGARTSADTSSRRLRIVHVALPADGDLRRAIDAALGDQLHRWVLIDPWSARIPVGQVAGILDRVVHLALDPLDPPAERPVWHLPATVVQLLDRPGTVHVAAPARIARIRLRPGDELRPAELDADRAGRFSRMLTQRRVGVALGGGGSWGYAHVAFLRALHALDVPVDMVSGSSFGALTGAFYCTRGLAGLDELCTHGGGFNKVLVQSMFSSAAISRWIDARLRGPDGKPYRIQDLEVAFAPCSTDLNNDMTYVVSEGTVGHGTRLSSTMPPTITPVIVGNSRYVDGGFRTNVPVEALIAAGVALRFSSNIVPPVRGVESPPTFPGRLGRALHAFNPVARVSDVARAMLVAFHNMGSLEGHGADVSFEPRPRPVKFWDFSGGDAIARDDYPEAYERARACRQLYVNLCSSGWPGAEEGVTPLAETVRRELTSVVAPARSGG